MTHIDAQRAIYIDFECLQRQPPQKPHPALLGVLIGAEDENFEQLITDERLAPARVANRERTRIVPAADAVETLLAMAALDDRKIVGWSLFDRDRLVDARPDLGSAINACYVNAIQIARPWRLKIYPGFTIAREDPFAPKHTLDKYARLAGYPEAHALEKKTPAKWIRHVLDQLTAAGGRYWQTTSETQRDWRSLLDYNRHECLALYHIVLKATREREAWRAYERTRFCVDDGKRRICFMAGSQSRRLDSLLERHDADRWAFVTAWNPASELLTPAENHARQARLRTAVAGYSMLPGEGIGQDPAWTPEESLLVLNISRREAIRLGRQFGQLAIVAGRRGSKSRLVSCAKPPRPARRNPVAEP